MIIMARPVVTFPVGRALFAERCHGENLPDAVRYLVRVIWSGRKAAKSLVYYAR
jgi:hypothetical protein